MSAFSSLLVTLTANDQDPHDLLDAYHTLSHRLRCFLHNDRGDVLGPLRSTIDSLKRDINRALINPFSSAYENSLLVISLAPDDLKRATDSVAVCHAALQFVSLLFRFESLYRLFSGTFPLFFHLTNCSSQPSNRPPITLLNRPLPLPNTPNPIQHKNTCASRMDTPITAIAPPRPLRGRGGG